MRRKNVAINDVTLCNLGNTSLVCHCSQQQQNAALNPFIRWEFNSNARLHQHKYCDL